MVEDLVVHKNGRITPVTQPLVRDRGLPHRKDRPGYATCYTIV